MRLMVRLLICSISLSVISAAVADDKKELYDKGVAATNAGDIFSASDAFCELSRSDKKYKDAELQCQTYRDLTTRALFRYKINFADGMVALQNGDFSTAEAKFRNVKRGEFSEQARQQLATIAKWKEKYPTIRPKREQGPPLIMFGKAEISLGMSKSQVSRELSGALWHLKLAADNGMATVVADQGDSPEGQIKFDDGEAIYVVHKAPAKTPEDLARMLADAGATLEDYACKFQDYASTESRSSFTMLCGPYSIGVLTSHAPDNVNSTTELAIQIGSTDPASQMVQKATVLGTVSSRTGAPMPGVVLLLENKDTGFIKTATTGADGSFSITRVPPAAGYKITASTQDGTQIGLPREHIDIPIGDEREIIPPLREPASGAPKNILP